MAWGKGFNNNIKSSSQSEEDFSAFTLLQIKCDTELIRIVVEE